MSLKMLPSSIIVLIFCQIDVESLINTIFVNKEWNSALKNQRIWKKLYEMKFLSSPPNIEDWKKLFIRRYYSQNYLLKGKCTLSR